MLKLSIGIVSEGQYGFLYKVLLCIISITVFLSTFFNGFQIWWDDQWMLTSNMFVTNLTWESFRFHLTHFYHGQYYPVNTLMYVWLFELFGLTPWAFHACSLLLHLLNLLLVFAIVKTCVAAAKPAFNQNRQLMYTTFVTLIFAIHPLQVESVAWISASKVLLFAFYTLLGSWLYIRYILIPRWWKLYGVLLCYLLAFGSKEQAIIFPLLLMVFDWFFRRFSRSGKSFRGYLRLILEKLPFLLLALAMWLFSTDNSVGNFNVERAYPLYQRLVFGVDSFMYDIYRSIAPVKLYYFYFYPIKLGEKLPVNLLLSFIPFLIVLFFIRENYRKGNRLVILGFLIFVVNLLLVLHLIPIPRQMISADRYMYLSMVGIALVAVWIFDYLHCRFTEPSRWMAILAAIYPLALCCQSFYRTTQWDSSETIKRNIKELIDKKKREGSAVVNNPMEEPEHEKP